MHDCCKALIVIVLGVVLGLVLSAPAMAVSQCRLIVPQDCEYLSSEFSTGGADSPSWVVEYDCRRSDGTIVKHLDWDFSVSGYFGFGRMLAPRRIIFVPKAVDDIELDC